MPKSSDAQLSYKMAWYLHITYAHPSLYFIIIFWSVFIFIEVMLIYNIRDVSRVNILFLLRSPPQHAHHPNLVSLCHHQLIPITHVILLLSPSPLATTTLFSVSTCLFSLKQHHFLIIALLMVLMWAFIIEAKTIQSLVYAYLNFLVFLP